MSVVDLQMVEERTNVYLGWLALSHLIPQLLGEVNSLTSIVQMEKRMMLRGVERLPQISGRASSDLFTYRAICKVSDLSK